MSWDPYQQKKFVSRKYRLALDENYHLDKIRGEKRERKKLTLNVWTTLAVSVAIFLIAFMIPTIAKVVIVRRHTDAQLEAANARDSVFRFTDQYPAENTLFVVEKSGRYYVFWYDSNANGMKKDGEDIVAYPNIVELSRPESGRGLPVNIAPSRSFEYPFRFNPIERQGDSVRLTDGLQLLTDCTIKPYNPGENDELEKYLNNKNHTITLYTITHK